MSNYQDRIQHHCPTGGRSLRIADDHGAEHSVHGLQRAVDVAYKAWLRRRGLMDEEQQTKYEELMAKARKVKALRRACK